jgi:hypothetical protein
VIGPRVLVFGEPPAAGLPIEYSGRQYEVYAVDVAEDHGYGVAEADYAAGNGGALRPRAWWVTLRDCAPEG